MADPPFTLDPERLADFISEIEAAGFVAVGDGRSYVGQLPESLRSFTTATEMTLIIHDPWPYRQPSVIGAGIDWWHAAHDAPCLWQPDDNTKRWLSVAGILERIDEWAEQAVAGFTTIDGAALDPQLYFESSPIGLVGLDIDGLIGGLAQDGQHGRVHLAWAADSFAEARSGKGPVDALPGHWFYKTTISSPPRDRVEFEAALSDKQTRRLESLLARAGRGLFVLSWPTVHGTAVLGLIITQTAQGREAKVITPTPISQPDRLRRAGPDAAVLRVKRVVLFGVGAVGSHVASLLARSGLKTLILVDGDLKVPVGLVRHAFGGVGINKAEEARDLLRAFEWTAVEAVPTNTWDVPTLRGMISGADLCVDATGNSLFGELLSRICAESATPFIGVALFRGGRVLRVRRQAVGDRPLTDRVDDWRYPLIPAGEDPTVDFVGAETGCAAAIHNAPPAAVTAAASTTMLVAADLLTGRRSFPDEVIDVLEPIEAPFNRFGRFRPIAPKVMLTARARTSMVSAAVEVRPNETGGILIGAHDNAGACCVVHAIEFRPEQPSAQRYYVPEGVTQPAVDKARVEDTRLEYVGEWHSHPTDQPASPTDTATMLDLTGRPDVGRPMLIVLRPTTPEHFGFDAYVIVADSLELVDILDVGDLPPREAA